MKTIDLRSDTVTQPTVEMRHAMVSADTGDDVYNDDPTAKKLETKAAEKVGKEAALFVPSGTMANQIAIMYHTRRGDAIIVGRHCHIVAHEVGGAAVLSGANYRIIDNPDQTITAADIEANLGTDDIHYPDTALVCLENALSNGNVVPLETMREAYAAAKKHNLPVHLDGARIFNAAEHLQTTAKEIAQHCDTLMFCLSKGLCAPVGSMLCGDAAFIARARKLRKLLGGGMRQTGVLAAAGIVALDRMTQRLRQDHQNAQYLYKKLTEIPQITATPPQINMVFFKISTPHFDHPKFTAHLLKNNIKTNAADNNEYRFVTHNDITQADLDTALAIIKAYLQ